MKYRILYHVCLFCDVWQVCIIGDEPCVAYEEVLYAARTAGLTRYEHAVVLGGVVGPETDVGIEYEREELTRRTEGRMLFSALRVPVGVAVVLDAAAAAREGRGEFVTVTEVVPVCAALVQKTAAGGIRIIRGAVV